MTKAFFPGSFDPLTLGHLEFVKRASQLFDEVVIGVMTNPHKHYLLTAEERLHLVKESVQALDKVQVAQFSNQLTVQIAHEIGADVLIRGLRNPVDYAYEQEMAQVNYQQTKIETLFLQATPEMQGISSSIVRELWRFGGYYACYVPPCVAQYMAEKKVDEWKN